MTWQRQLDERVTSPRLIPRQVKSARALYRPAIKDLSNEAAWAIGEVDDQTFLTTLCGYPGTEETPESFVKTESQPGEMGSHIDVTRMPTPLYNTPIRRTPISIDDNLRNQRLTCSASSRLRLLSSFKRPRSVDSYLQSPMSIPYPDYYKDHRQFVVRNANHWQETSPQTFYKPLMMGRDIAVLENTERKVTHRPLIRGSSQTGSLLSDGFKGQTNGFHEHLINSHPQIKQRVSIWLTNGFKVQSLRLKNITRNQKFKSSTTGRLLTNNDRKSANEAHRLHINAMLPGYNVNTGDGTRTACDLRIIPANSGTMATKNL